MAFKISGTETPSMNLVLHNSVRIMCNSLKSRQPVILYTDVRNENSYYNSGYDRDHLAKILDVFAIIPELIEKTMY